MRHLFPFELKISLNTMKLLVIIVIIILSFIHFNKPEGICTRVKTVQRSKWITVQGPYSYETKRKCGFLWTKTCHNIVQACCRPQSQQIYFTDHENENYCCPGYSTTSINPLICTPICSKSCINGNCTAPNVCTCNHGYHLDNYAWHKCNPICTSPCQNGICIAPEQCKCNAGYTADPKNNHICNPICAEDCQNGICIAPETCHCNKGYVIQSDNNYTCVPVCTKSCLNGICVPPATCQCNKGYAKDPEDSSICKPICSKSCGNGICIAPETCKCNEGYSADPENPTSKHICNPTCVNQCINGNCIRPNICECWNGYKMQNDGYTCWNNTCNAEFCNTTEISERQYSELNSNKKNVLFTIGVIVVVIIGVVLGWIGTRRYRRRYWTKKSEVNKMLPIEWHRDEEDEDLKK